MQVPSNILAILSEFSGSMQPTDGIISVDPAVALTAEIPLPHLEVPPFATFVPRQSFMTTITQFKSNSAGSFNQGAVVLSPGVWKLRIHGSFFSNYIDTGGTFAGLNIGSAVGTFLSAPLVFPVCTGYVSLERTIMLVNQDQRVLYISGPGNGVGQTYSLACDIAGDRIL